MTGRSDFTEQEWQALRKGVTGAAMWVSVSDRGFFDSFQEAGALARHLVAARREGSELTRALSETRGTGFALTSSPDEIERETTDALRTAVSTLDAKAPEEVDAYRAFVLEVAQSVAAAAGGGDQAESEVVERIRTALSRGSSI
jgi:hypothetical protein